MIQWWAFLMMMMSFWVPEWRIFQSAKLLLAA